MGSSYILYKALAYSTTSLLIYKINHGNQNILVLIIYQTKLINHKKSK